MNGIIYRLIIFTFLTLAGCKKQSQENIDQNNKSIKIEDIKIITIKDTLYLKYNSENLGQEWREYQDYKSQYSPLLIDKRDLSSDDIVKFENFEYNNEEDLNFLLIKRRVKLNPNYNTLILSNPESVYVLFNYNNKGELVDFLDLKEYNQLICDCKPTVYIDPSGIIHCYTETGYPYYPYVWYKVNDEGKFEISKEYTPPNDEKMSSIDRLQYAIEKIPLLDNNFIALPKDLGPNNPFFSTSVSFNNSVEFQRVLFSKSEENLEQMKIDGVFSEIFSFKKEKYYLFGKQINRGFTLLITYLKSKDSTCVIFILDSKNKVISSKRFDIQEEQGRLKVLQKENEFTIEHQIDKINDLKIFTIDNKGKFIER